MTTTKTAHEALTGKRASTRIQRRIVGYVGSPYKWGEGDTRVGTPQQAIVVGSGFGDGSYQVTADIDSDGRVRRISIDFDK